MVAAATAPSALSARTASATRVITLTIVSAARAPAVALLVALTTTLKATTFSTIVHLFSLSTWAFAWLWAGWGPKNRLVVCLGSERYRHVVRDIYMIKRPEGGFDLRKDIKLTVKPKTTRSKLDNWRAARFPDASTCKINWRKETRSKKCKWTKMPSGWCLQTQWDFDLLLLKIG